MMQRGAGGGRLQDLAYLLILLLAALFSHDD